MNDYQIFISYRRDGGDYLAGRLADRFNALGYKVFFDVESMRSGTFNTQILDAIAQCKDVLLVLPPKALERCVNTDDWVRQELAFALKNNKNIIPIMMRGFEFPATLPADIDQIRYMEGVVASSEYFDAVIQRIESLLISKNVINNYETSSRNILEETGYVNYFEGKIAVGAAHVVILRQDGTVIAVGDNRCGQCNVSDWKDIISIAASGYLTVGLKKDGTVIYAGATYGNVDLSQSSVWKDIISVYASNNCIFAIKNNGKPFSVGVNNHGQCDTLPWNQISKIAGGYNHTIGLRKDGTVVATGDNSKGQCDVSSWENIVDIATGTMHSVGLRADGTVVASGKNDFGECNLSQWENVVAITACQNNTVGIKADGTVIQAGQNCCGKYDLSSWRDIICICAGSKPSGMGDLNVFFIGITSDGKVFATGDNQEGQINI